MSDVNELLEQAIKETENLNEGEVFLVKDRSWMSFRSPGRFSGR